MTKIQFVGRALIGAGLLLSLASCGGGGGGSNPQPDPVKVTTTAQEDKFGMAFGTDFRASPNTEPANVSDGDIVPVSLTTEPIDITP